MKKTISVLMILLLLLTACGQKEVTVQTADSGETQIANPWREVTEAEAKAVYPQTFAVPVGAENAVWRLMESAGTPALLELDFELDGMRFTARQQQTGDRAEDLSGMQYTWTSQDSVTLRSGLAGNMYRCAGEDGYADLCTLYDGASGVSYSLGVTAKDLDGFDLQAVAEALFPPAVPDIGEQERILEENRSLWTFDGDGYAPDWQYAFTDLDHNGLLEVLSASTQGSGIFTYVRFYEVLPDGSGVRDLCSADTQTEGPDDWPEIALDTIPCYHDSASDRYYYVCSNDLRDGAGHSVTQLAAICLKDGTATVEYLAAADVQQTQDGEQRTYTDGEGNPITEEEYMSAEERRFSGMERSELKPDWTAVTSPQAGPVREDGERFEAVIVVEGMEETVQYEHVRSDALGFEMDYDYENFVRRSEADRECFISSWDDPDNPENYLEVRKSPQDAKTAAAEMVELLSNEYEVRREDDFVLERAGSCIRLHADEVKGGGYMPEQLQTVYVIPAGEGCLIATEHCYIVESEGFSVRFRSMMDTLAVTDGTAGVDLSAEQALAAVRRYCALSNPGLESVVKEGKYPVYWEIESSSREEIVVLFRSYTGALTRYLVDPVSGETSVTESVPGITSGEQPAGERFNAKDYLLSV